MNFETKTTDISDPADGASSSVERRSFLGVLIGAITAGIGAVLGVTIGRYVVEPALADSSTEQWVDAGLLAEIPEGQAVKRNVIIAQNVGWGQENTQGLVWIHRQGETITVYSAVCPHLGCTINHSANGFLCPCHKSSWDGEGKKNGGPTPRNMDVLEHRIEGGALQVKYQNFKIGIAEKEAV